MAGSHPPGELLRGYSRGVVRIIYAGMASQEISGLFVDNFYKDFARFPPYRYYLESLEQTLYHAIQYLDRFGGICGTLMIDIILCYPNLFPRPKTRIAECISALELRRSR